MSHKLTKISSMPISSALCGVRPRNKMSVPMAIMGEKYVTDAIRVAPQRFKSAIMSKNATADENTPALTMESTNLVLKTDNAGVGSVSHETASKIPAAKIYW